ncbi:hypothetical protein Q8F55_005672 [Vanrija albida]|uniref:Uncharacterized protein n=1 Tax=Vanrija albida TaxID=181172 RepID=A0ABR3Q3B4_9TREE
MGPVISNDCEQEIIQYCEEICIDYGLQLKYYGRRIWALTTGSAGSLPFPELRDALERGELERRLTRREARELIKEGWVRLRPWHEGYAGSSKAANLKPPGFEPVKGSAVSVPVKQPSASDPGPSTTAADRSPPRKRHRGNRDASDDEHDGVEGATSSTNGLLQELGALHLIHDRHADGDDTKHVPDLYMVNDAEPKTPKPQKRLPMYVPAPSKTPSEPSSSEEEEEQPATTSAAASTTPATATIPAPTTTTAPKATQSPDRAEKDLPEDPDFLPTAARPASNKYPLVPQVARASASTDANGRISQPAR